MDIFVRKYFIYTAIYVATLNTRLARGNQEFRRHVTYVWLRNIRRIIFQWNAIHILFSFFVRNARITRFFYKWKTSVNNVRNNVRIEIVERVECCSREGFESPTRWNVILFHIDRIISIPAAFYLLISIAIRWHRNRMLSQSFVRIVQAVFYTHAIVEKT